MINLLIILLWLALAAGALFAGLVILLLAVRGAVAVVGFIFGDE